METTVTTGSTTMDKVDKIDEIDEKAKIDDGDLPIAIGVQLIPNSETAATPVDLPSTGGSHTEDVREQQLKLLKDQGFTAGLAKALYGAKTTFPLRIWVVDNSGSMQNSDGKLFVETADPIPGMKIVPCTRWLELQESVNYHIDLCGLIKAPTKFRLLNDASSKSGQRHFDVATNGDAMIKSDMEEARRIISKAIPLGPTPMTQHINEIRDAVIALEDELQQRGQRVSLILATDGLPSDSNGNSGKDEQTLFIDALRSLQGLPMWIVIRLCTDEYQVVKFYSELLDQELELSLDVLDDFVSECKEVKKYNSWFNYALPMHRTREMGFHDRLFDMIDERHLTHQELHQFCVFLFGVDTMPDPARDWKGFIREIRLLNDAEEPQWNPIKKKMLPWINIKKLDKGYGKFICTLM
jgi:hypothetical protein